MEIKFVFEEDHTETYDKEIGRIIIDGTKDNESELKNNYLRVRSQETFDKLKKASFRELDGFFSTFSYSFDVEWSEYPIYLKVEFSDLNGDGRYILVNLIIEYAKWSKPYTLYEFVETHKKVVNGIASINYVEAEDIREEWAGNFFQLKVIIENISDSLENYVVFVLEKLKEVHLLATEILSNKYFLDGVSVLYEFPDEVRTACKQYLIYFAQFLEDLGINAETSLKEQANRVLFTVTPKDKNQALDVIYKALSIYMDASSQEVSNNISESDLAVMQWKANIFHLRSQLELSKAIMQAKDETIDALKLANYQLQSFIPKSESKEDLENKDEKILDGLVSVNNLKLKGATINLPEILRRLKRRFK